MRQLPSCCTVASSAEHVWSQPWQCQRRSGHVLGAQGTLPRQCIHLLSWAGRASYLCSGCSQLGGGVQLSTRLGRLARGGEQQPGVAQDCPGQLQTASLQPRHTCSAAPGSGCWHTRCVQPWGSQQRHRMSARSLSSSSRRKVSACGLNRAQTEVLARGLQMCRQLTCWHVPPLLGSHCPVQRAQRGSSSWHTSRSTGLGSV